MRVVLQEGDLTADPLDKTDAEKQREAIVVETLKKERPKPEPNNKPKINLMEQYNPCRPVPNGQYGPPRPPTKITKAEKKRNAELRKQGPLKAKVEVDAQGNAKLVVVPKYPVEEKKALVPEPKAPEQPKQTAAVIQASKEVLLPKPAQTNKCARHPGKDERVGEPAAKRPAEQKPEEKNTAEEQSAKKKKFKKKKKRNESLG